MTLEMHARRHAPRLAIALLCSMFLVVTLVTSRGRSNEAANLRLAQDDDVLLQPQGKELLLIQAVFRCGRNRAYCWYSEMLRLRAFCVKTLRCLSPVVVLCLAWSWACANGHPGLHRHGARMPLANLYFP